MENTARFSNRVENYVKYRPGYPPGVLELFRDEMNLTSDSAIADIGAGTGISAKLFLDNGNKVFAVEPNDAMREAAEAALSVYPKYHSVKGTAENTTLPDDSVDIVTAAQAFHWFDPKPAHTEFIRMLKPGGFIALIWNERRLDADAFHLEYEKFLLNFANDYTKVRHENVTKEKLEDFFGRDLREKTFENAQTLDLDGLQGRVLSSSYMPTQTDSNFEPMSAALRGLFAKYAENDRIKVLYQTNVFYGRI